MRVIINGVPFVPASASVSRIGITITTHQRADVLKRALEQHMKHIPAGALHDMACIQHCKIDV